MLLPIADRAGHAALRAAGFQSRTIPTAGGLVHAYEWTGKGTLPPIVVVHGIGSHAVHMARVLIGLREQASRILAPDLPGHGRSATPPGGLDRATMTDGVRESFDRLIEEPSILVGNSLGGLAVIRYAIERRDRVLGVFLVSPGGAPAEGDELERFLEQFRMPHRRAAMRFLETIHVHRPWYAPLIAGDIRRTFEAGPLRAFVDGVRSHDLLTAAEVGSLDMPGRVLWGRADKLLPSAQREFFRNNLPAHVGFEEPEGFSHCPHFDSPRELTAEIVRFAREIA